MEWELLKNVHVGGDFRTTTFLFDWERGRRWSRDGWIDYCQIGTAFSDSELNAIVELGLNYQHHVT